MCTTVLIDYISLYISLPLLASSVQLQEEVNCQSIEVLSTYIDKYLKYMKSGGTSAM